ncbi:MAG: hypothetical protein CEE42_04350 [Promethearchaeota archaeon Loki_b31]|nr:MAG: hypothetical protein CEE42_04350 [Candidatus Lokiarchaeota archaeon Loki_b31]
MDFSRSVKKEIVKVSADQYAPKACPSCGNSEITIRTSHKRIISELGNIDTELFIELHVATFECKNCGAKYTPEHVDYPKGYEYSRRIIQTALSMHFQDNVSGNKIAAQLAKYFSVQIPPKTIYSWVNALTEEFMKSEFKTEPEKALEAYKALTIDGTGFSLGNKLLGKKKNVPLASAVKLSNGIYLLTWWE